MAKSRTVQVADWLLGEIPRHQHPTEQELRAGARSWFADDTLINGRTITQALDRLKSRQLVEKYRVPGATSNPPRAWRLTLAGEQWLECRATAREIHEAAPL